MAKIYANENFPSEAIEMQGDKAVAFVVLWDWVVFGCYGKFM